LGGALGNIVDRVFYGAWFAGMNNYDAALLHGRVVDMFHLDLGSFRIFGSTLELLPVFNLADAAITVGIVAILLFQRKFLKGTEAPATPGEEKEAPAEAIENHTEAADIAESEKAEKTEQELPSDGLAKEGL
jgi:signal peptidase II